MKKTEKRLEVDFFSKVLPDISETFECMNPTMQDIVRLATNNSNTVNPRFTGLLGGKGSGPVN